MHIQFENAQIFEFSPNKLILSALEHNSNVLNNFISSKFDRAQLVLTYEARVMQRRGYALGGQLRGASGTQYKYDVEGNLIRKILPTGEVWQYERIVLGSLPT